MSRLKLMKGIWNFSTEKLKSIWALFATIFGVVSVVIPQKRLYVVIFLLFIILSVIILCQNWRILHKRVIDIEPRSNRSFNIMVDDFIENLKYNIKNNITEETPLAVAIGIDISLKLSNTSSGSILSDLITFFNNNYKISDRELQSKIDEAATDQLSGKVKFGDVIHVPIELDTNSQVIDFLFVVNSSKDNVNSSRKNDILKGEDSRIIIIKLFKKCDELKLKSLMLGAIGTNKLYFPYKIIITEIINAYVFCIEKACEPKKVYLSLREQDMVDQELESREIIDYITQSMKFISK